jgi:hypothetical protein
MEIAPIPNLIPMRPSAPSAAPADLPTTRAVDLRRQQDQDDATYTPSRREEGKKHGEKGPNNYEAAETAPDSDPDAALNEPISRSTISVFA